MNAFHPDPDALLSVKKVAERLAVSPSTVRRLHDDGTLPGVKPRRRRLWPASEVQRYIARLQGMAVTS